MSVLTDKEKLACKNAKLFAEEYLLVFAELIAKGTRPSIAHHEAVLAAQVAFSHAIILD